MAKFLNSLAGPPVFEFGTNGLRASRLGTAARTKPSQFQLLTSTLPARMVCIRTMITLQLAE